MIPLAAFEEIIDASGVAARIEAMLPAGVRPRQLRVRTLLAGMCLAQADHRPAHLTRVHQALTALGGDDQRRLGVIADWKHGPHQLTYRQTERTFGLVADALGKDEPDGLPSGPLQRVCDELLEAGIPQEFKNGSRSLAVDWTDLESFSRPPPARGGHCADPEAWWGHRKNNLLRSQDELFYGYYLSAGIMMRDEDAPALPELARRATVSSCRHYPVRAFTPVLTAMPAAGIPLGDILDDSGYAHRDASAWAIPPGPPGRSSSRTSTPTTAAQGHPRRRDHQQRQPVLPPDTAAAARTWAARPHRHQRAGRGLGTQDQRAGPAQARPPHQRRPGRQPPRAMPPAMGKIRCPLRPSSMTLDRDRPEILTPPDTPRPAAPSRPSPSPRTCSPRPRKTRLPVRGLAPVLRPPHRRRARLRHRQGPRQQRHQPRLVPSHGPGTPHAVHHRPARHPQPAHPARLEHPPGRNPAPRSRRAPARKPGAAAARPSPCSPPRRHRQPGAPGNGRRQPHGTRPKAPGPATAAMPACPRTSRATRKVTAQTRNARSTAAAPPRQPARRIVRPKRENRPH